MDEASTGQIIGDAADVYEAVFVPALFAAWPPHLADAAGLAPGMAVLDVACGTGVLAREAARRVLPGGRVAGLDRNADMLRVARRQSSAVEWHLGRAEALPFAEHSFDAVVSQFGLMFFEDRTAALKSMWRILKPGGSLVVAVWDTLERTPGYAAMHALLQALFGEQIANELRAPFTLGDPGDLRRLIDSAGIGAVDLRTIVAKARFPSIEAWVRTDVKGWTLADLIDQTQYDQLQAAAQGELRRFAGRDGSVAFDSPAHIVTARKL